MPANKYSDSLLMDALRGSLSNAESFGRGFGVAPVGLLGDINALARGYITPRLPANVQGLLQSMPSAPTTESILSAIPRMTAPRMESSGMEQIGAAANPRGPINLGRAVASLPSDIQRAGMEYLQASAQPMYAVKPTKAPRMSAEEARAAGYWHDIGAGKKLPIPISEMRAKLEDVSNLPPKIIRSPETMQGGAIVPFSGDRSTAGKNLLGIGDIQFETPVYLEGGYDFMRANSPTGSIWASEKGAARSLQNRINEASQLGGGDVYGIYTAMGPESMNFNTMMSDALLEQMRAGKISKKNIAAFDKEVHSLRPEWKGVMNPESRAQLESNGALRHAFVDRMQLDKFENAGFPNIAYTRYAITDPLLLNEPMYSGGLAIGKMKPKADLITDPMTPHKTYDTQLAGEYFGSLEQSLPKQVLFPDWYKMRREIGAPESGDIRSFQFAKPIQPTNQEWVDSVMQYLSSQKSLLD